MAPPYMIRHTLGIESARSNEGIRLPTHCSSTTRFIFSASHKTHLAAKPHEGHGYTGMCIPKPTNAHVEMCSHMGVAQMKQLRQISGFILESCRGFWCQHFAACMDWDSQQAVRGVDGLGVPSPCLVSRSYDMHSGPSVGQTVVPELTVLPTGQRVIWIAYDPKGHHLALSRQARGEWPGRMCTRPDFHQKWS